MFVQVTVYAELMDSSYGNPRDTLVNTDLIRTISKEGEWRVHESEEKMFFHKISFSESHEIFVDNESIENINKKDALNDILNLF